MPITSPTPDQLHGIADECGLALTGDDLAFFGGQLSRMIAAYNFVAAQADEVPPVKYPRTPGRRPSAAENTHNAWYWKTSIPGASKGKLKGKRIALKDNIMLSGVPMMNGSATLEGYVPDFDATIVTRMLDAGAEIVGKAHCESFCLSGDSYTNATGPIHNPYRMGYSAGGSSSGSGVVVALGEADMAIGCDQGGSIRLPSSVCGIYGMKPTWGLVPYTGIMPIEIFIDHAGPMTASVADNALLLEVIAGDDGFDPRIKSPKPGKYTEALGQDVKGLKIGLLKEGFAHQNMDEAVRNSVEKAAERFRELGAIVDEVSVPMHAVAGAIWTPIGTEGMAQTMMYGDGFGRSRRDLYATSLMGYHRGWRGQADLLSDSTKALLMLGTYIDQQFGPRYYGKAVNISRRLRAAYDAVLADYDLLLMPTIPSRVSPLPTPETSRQETAARSFGMILNTAAFNVTHHPAMSVPCGMVDGLPVGMMLVGRHFEEQTIYRAAHAFEQSGDWKRM